MVQIVTGLDGTRHEFPDTATPEQITSALKGFKSDSDDALVSSELKSGGLGPKRAKTITDNYQLGALKGMLSVPDAGAQLVTRAIESLSPSGSGIEAWAKRQRESVEGVNRQREQFYQANKGEGSETGELVGNLAVTVPMSMMLPTGGATFGGRFAAGTGQGAGFGALQPVQEGADYWTEKLKQTVMGAGAGAAGATVGEGVARVVAPKASTDPNVQRLMEAGVRPTPGQIMGGGAKRTEEKIASIPFVGGAIQGGQKRAIEQFNRAAVNESLEPVGKSLPMNVKTGRDAIEYAGKELSKAYDDLLPKISAQADKQFVSEMTNLASLAKNMPEARFKQFDGIIKKEVLDKMSKTGTWTGESLKEIESELGRLGRLYRRSESGDEQLLADAFQEAQRIVRNLVERANPHLAKELQAVNTAYSKFLRVENAAARLGAGEGTFTPSQLTGAVRQMDSTLRKRGFARGNAVMQDLAEAGKTVLNNKVPNSGSIDRLLAALGTGSFLTAPGAVAAHFANPLVAAGTLPAAMYTGPGQSLMAHLLATRPPQAQAAAEAIRSMYPMLGPSLLLGGNNVLAGLPAAGN